MIQHQLLHFGDIVAIAGRYQMGTGQLSQHSKGDVTPSRTLLVVDLILFR